VYSNPDNASDPAGVVVQFNRSVGDYNVAGTRNDALSISVDGADVIDPGCNCGAAVTANVDMTQEVKVQTANFGAENAKGPVVIQTVSKGGSSEFHGEAYIYARHSKFNSQNWLNNRFDSPKPQDSFYFPGFNIGGPLTKGRNKLFFFAGVEWMRQNVAMGLQQAVVPTQAMRQGDFSDSAYIESLNGDDINLMPMNDAEQPVNDDGDPAFNTASAWGQDPLDSNMLSGGVINPDFIDPGGQVLTNIYPLPNRDPAANNGYNYVSDIVNPQHRTQQLVRIDYNLSDNTKLYTRFNHEFQDTVYPYTLWWTETNPVPYPSRYLGKYHTYSTATSLVNVLNPTTTNEVVFTLTAWSMPHALEDPSKVSRAGLGYPYDGIFNNSAAYGQDVIPDVLDWGGGVATLFNPGAMQDPTIFGHKWLINASDNFTKVAGTHLLKFGVFFQLTTNKEPQILYDQGLITPTNWGGNSTGNAYADLLMGRVGSYEESNKNWVPQMRQREWAFYAQDSWKATRRLTLEFGARLYHFGWMYDPKNTTAGFDFSQYDPTAPIDAYSGIVSRDRGDDIPRSVLKTPFLRVGPRLGFAFDLSGKGNTVIRGGMGQFYYRDRTDFGTYASANPPLMVSTTLGYAAGTLSSIDQLTPQDALIKPNIVVLDLEDGDRVPTTYSWSLTLSHRLPSATVLETSYVGNTSRNLVTPDGLGLNAVPEGAMFGFPLGTDENEYRPFLNYGTISYRQHLLSQNYHSLQVTANRQTGRINYSAAYTWAKTLGVGGDFYGDVSAVDHFDRRGRSYGPLPYDRSHSLSVAYNIFLPDPTRTRVLKEILNGWQVSGISQWQSGAPLLLGNDNIGGTMATGEPIGPIQVAGTSDILVRPFLTCDPRAGLGDGQYANPNCFTAPQPGQNGHFQLPYMHHPAFQNHDLSVFKNFPLGSEDRKLQFRFSMYNFLNHPLPFFEGGGPGTALNFEDGVLDQDSTENFGRPTLKRGRRLMQFAIKFFF
jgi:hypothetical protein